MRKLLFVLCICALGGCGIREGGPQRTIDTVQWISNLPLPAQGPLVLDLDGTDAVHRGFRAPSLQQAPDGRFHFRFHLKDGQGRRFGYKLYYQNTASKFPEATSGGGQHPQASENFYGSWEDASEGFRLTDRVPDDGLWVEDAFRIQGDPRDEPRYLQDGVRHREGRNPRTGAYRLMLVVVAEESLAQGCVPEAVRCIACPVNGHYVEPFWYFLHGPGRSLPGVQVEVSNDILVLRSRPSARNGIHIDPGGGLDPGAFCTTCGDTPGLNARAEWTQHFHHIDAATGMQQVPAIADLDTFTYGGYCHLRAFTPKDAFLPMHPSTSRRPCSTVRVDASGDAIELRNPACGEGALRKESVGIRTRNALSYGRYRIRCELPRLLNEHDLWNGLTNAIWLVGRDDPWNTLHPCEGGYLASYDGGAQDQRLERANYAEIDFEILKGVPYCPQNGFPPNYAQPVADPRDVNAWAPPLPDAVKALQGQVMVACTNWDMACPEPERFDVGCHPVQHEGRVFDNFRWDHGYRALTQKVPAADAEIFGRPYWFEIEWRPQSITWRIGPDPEHLRVVGYMDGTVTSIPDLPMRLVVTQEYHNTAWWPGSPYEQRFIPFSAKDHVGRVLEVIID